MDITFDNIISNPARCGIETPARSGYKFRYQLITAKSCLNRFDEPLIHQCLITVKYVHLFPNLLCIQFAVLPTTVWTWKLKLYGDWSQAQLCYCDLIRWLTARLRSPDTVLICHSITVSNWLFESIFQFLMCYASSYLLNLTKGLRMTAV